MLHLPLFRIRSFSAANVIGFVAQFSVAAIALLEVLWFERVQHASVLTAGARILPLMVAYVAISSVAAYLARRVGFKATIGVGLSLLVIATVIALGQNPGTAYGQTGVMLAIFGVGFGLVLPPTTAAAVISLPHHEGGTASATVNMFRQVGAALGSSITGTLLTSGLISRLPRALADHGVPAAAVGRAAHAVATGAGPASAPSPLRHPIAAAAGDAFAGSLHVAVLVPGGAAALAALVAFAFISNRPAHLPQVIRTPASLRSAIVG
jgi:DHA2 family multidrug resistance protein-like MFS transporter